MPSEIRIDAFLRYDFFEHDSEHIIEGHCHDTWKIYIVMEGQILATCSDKIFQLNMGDVLVVAPWVYHRFKVGKDGAKRAVISFESHDNGNYPEYLAKALSPDEFALARLCVADLAEVYAQDVSVITKKSRQYINGLKMCEVLLSRVNDAVDQMTGISSLETIIYSKTACYMEEHVSENITMETLSKELQVGQQILKKIFKEYTDGGTITYFHNMKIRYAIKYLRSGYSVTEVSNMLSFSSVNHFSAFFKKMIGESPKRYQMQMNVYRLS